MRGHGRACIALIIIKFVKSGGQGNLDVRFLWCVKYASHDGTKITAIATRPSEAVRPFMITALRSIQTAKKLSHS